ncbi:MAG: AtpZ/AtpI family protein [Schleiferiaceae bacterium]|nr:AtpZ/AtpI family protein [Schleiferiaceae bacterium]
MSKTEPPPQKPNRPRDKKDKSPLQQYVFYSGLGFQMLAIILSGALLGDWLDDTYQVENRLFTILLSLLSIFLALFITLRKLLRRP